MAVTIERIGTTKDQIGESPIWDPAEHALYWIDAEKGEIFRVEPATGKFRSWRVEPARHVGSMVLRKGGGALLATNYGFELYDFDTGKLTPSSYPEGRQPHTRLNDGKVDTRGRFVAGEINLDSKLVGRFFRVDPGLKTRAARRRGRMLQRTLLQSRRPHPLLFRHDVGHHLMPAITTRRTGSVSGRRIFAKTTELGGSPDGCTVDADGRVWPALMRSGKVGCFTPDGKVERLIDVPPKHVSSTMFGGDNLDERCTSPRSAAPWAECCSPTTRTAVCT